MTEKLDAVLEKISTIADPANSSLIREFYQFMTDNRKSDSYKKTILRRSCFSVMNLLLMSSFTIFKRKERYLNF